VRLSPTKVIIVGRGRRGAAGESSNGPSEV
jgi:hypothetical protein